MSEEEHNILIATPAYNGQVHVEYLHALLSFRDSGIRYAVYTLANESLITRARNTLISRFWRLKEYSHLLFLDGDVFLDTNGLRNLIYHDKDVIGAPVALKSLDQNGRPKLNTDADPEHDVKLQSVSKVGTAVLMLSRTAVEALIDDARNAGRSYKAKDEAGNEETRFDVFQVGVLNDHYLSEDYWICQKLTDMGFEIFVDTSVYTRHSGVVAFDAFG